MLLISIAQAQVPPKRGAFLAAAASAHSVTLQGCTSTTPGVQFNFYRGTTPGGEMATAINPTPQATCLWTDTTVVGLATYYYTAKAYCATCVNGGVGLSGPSNEVQAVIPSDPQPAAPTGLTLGTVAKNSVPLLWQPMSPQGGYTPVGYYVMRGTSPTLPNPGRIAIVPQWQPNYTDKNCHGTCYYAVRAYDIGTNGNSFVTSASSNVVKAVQ